MKQFKRALATAGSGAVLALSMVGVAAADATTTVDCTSGSGVVSGNLCGGAAVDNSKDNSRHYTVNGNCSGVIFSDVEQSQNSNTSQSNSSDGGNAGYGGNNNSSNSNSSSTSQSQSAGVTFSPDCSTTTNTTVAAAQTAAPAQQVAAPKGGVGAGAGGAASETSSTAAIAGLVASAGSLGLGVIGRKKAFLGL